ncbi:putative prp18 domain containing protein [Lyophyllum shimeji]|uniref:Pre-mRNA-splicing factor 18 n=1 Tax=Lyophyllum shimeji TaxID=47721 RepID=A0A9P3PSK6_LYOSH|nr:putative prp18 domain containing protein [Lyophyllum shimeji]
MEALKAELNAKRKALQEDPLLASRPTKYMRRGEIERLKEEAKAKELKEREEAAAREQEAKEAKALARKDKLIPSRSATNSPHPGALDSDSSGGTPVLESSSLFNISNEEIVRRLRAKGQPIRLFAESDKDRRLRLRALELIEEKGHERQGGQNDFKKALEDVENIEKELQKKNNKGKKKDESEQAAVGVLDLELIKTDPDKLYPIIYYALKRTLKEWGEAMDERPEHVKRTTQGKLAAATQVQSAEYLKPLFRQLRSRSLPPDMLARIAEIVHHMQKRQYQRANDSYLRLSIGNAPWPIGVTMVGIHERSAREKISADQVAHVLNDEVSRKYIQSLKRLLTFSQSKYPPDDISQLMG